MKLGVVREAAANETRVALVPETVRKLKTAGWEISVQSGAGERAHFLDPAYHEAGAAIVENAHELARSSDVLVSVSVPSADLISNLKAGAVVIGVLDVLRSPDLLNHLSKAKLSAIAMELVPRITRAQSMDILSSQATVAGYRAVLLAAAASGRFFPMLMTAAGTIAPARVLVLGAGVAGLQAIATARRLGAVVQGFDIRPAVKEQVESLGATWVGLQVSGAEAAGGYAKAVSEDEQKKEHEHLTALVRDADIVISTAQVPGRKAPVLVTEAMVKQMKAGAVIVDLAADSGGNCEVTVANEDRLYNDVKVLGPTNLAAGLPTHASQMYSRNLATLLPLLKSEHGLRIDLADDILGVCCVVHDGRTRIVDGRIPAPEPAASSAA
jgi:NAD(P) transhydrogenase subunit alpha